MSIAFSFKTCKACGQEKPQEAYRAKRSLCRECEREKHRLWYAAQGVKPHQRDDMKEYYAAWYAKNRDRLIEKATAYSQAHPDMRRDVCRENMRRDRARLGDRYVRRMLAQQMSLTSKDIPQPLIEAQRELLRLKRALR